MPTAARREAWRAQRLCINCGKPAERSLCARCKRTQLASKKVRYDRDRKAAFEAYGGFVCACCSETEPLFLTLDHIADDGAEHRKRIGAGGAIYLWLARRGFPPGYRVLCLNCNMGRWRNGGACPHTEKQ